MSVFFSRPGMPCSKSAVGRFAGPAPPARYIAPSSLHPALLIITPSRPGRSDMVHLLSRYWDCRYRDSGLKIHQRLTLLVHVLLNIVWPAAVLAGRAGT